MTNPEQAEKPKIIVDEDWKEKVTREREELKAKERGGAAPGGADQSQETDQSQGTGAEPSLPPASLLLLVTTLATQAMAALGQLAESPDAKPIVHLGLAKHHIDTLELLEEKTRGNLDQDEAATLGNALHQLRMLYVTVKSRETA